MRDVGSWVLLIIAFPFLNEFMISICFCHEETSQARVGGAQTFILKRLFLGLNINQGKSAVENHCTPHR